MQQPETTSEMIHPDDTASPAPVPQVSIWKLTGLVWLLVLFVGGLFLLGWIPKVRQQTALAEETTSRQHEIPRVEVTRPYRAEPVVEASFPGEIEAQEETVIFPRTSGYLKKWHVDIGDVVEEGQLLAEIDTPEVDQQLQQALANVEQLKARREVATTKLHLARFTLDRFEKLIVSQAASQQEHDERRAEFSVAEQLVKAAEADVAAGIAELQRIRELQSFAKVYAPFDGTITERSVDLGQLVTAGNSQTQSLFRLVRTDAVRVIVHVPQVYASSLELGQTARVVVRELPRRDFNGHVARTARSLDARTRTMRAEIEVPNDEGWLLPGAYVEVRAMVRRENPPLVVPASALIFNANGCQIATVGPDDSIELRQVEVEADHGRTLGIATGITPSDWIVVNPGERLVDGLRVTVADKQAAEDLAKNE